MEKALVSTATQKLRAQVVARAKGRCEACGKPAGESGHMDHAFGRAKAAQSISSCWLLCLRCDEAKTQNRPSGAHWAQLFGEHCKFYGYLPELERARAKYLVLKARGLA